MASLYAHHLGVTAVQADDWKIVSGGGEGLVCVWELRMRAKLWEMHNRWVMASLSPTGQKCFQPLPSQQPTSDVLRGVRRHPVRHVRFNTSTLVTANIPDDKAPRGACITDDDLTAHRRSLPFTSGFKQEDKSKRTGVCGVPQMASVSLVQTMTRSDANPSPTVLPQIVVLHLNRSDNNVPQREAWAENRGSASAFFKMTS